jgi:hypothetical protein
MDRQAPHRMIAIAFGAVRLNALRASAIQSTFCCDPYMITFTEGNNLESMLHLFCVSLLKSVFGSVRDMWPVIATGWNLGLGKSMLYQKRHTSSYSIGC